MPAVSGSQQRLFAIAEKSPQKLYAANKGLAKLPKKTLSEFASTKRAGLPKRIK